MRAAAADVRRARAAPVAMPGVTAALTSFVVARSRSRTKTPRRSSGLPAARFVASDENATRRPSAEIDGSVDGPSAAAPPAPVARDTSRAAERGAHVAHEHARAIAVDRGVRDAAPVAADGRVEHEAVARVGDRDRPAPREVAYVDARRTAPRGRCAEVARRRGERDEAAVLGDRGLRRVVGGDGAAPAVGAADERRGPAGHVADEDLGAPLEPAGAEVRGGRRERHLAPVARDRGLEDRGVRAGALRAGAAGEL